MALHMICDVLNTEHGNVNRKHFDQGLVVAWDSLSGGSTVSSGGRVGGWCEPGWCCGHHRRLSHTGHWWSLLATQCTLLHSVTTNTGTYLLLLATWGTLLWPDFTYPVSHKTIRGIWTSSISRTQVLSNALYTGNYILQNLKCLSCFIDKNL